LPGDPVIIHPYLAEIGREKRKVTTGDVVDTGAAALHLAIRCASGKHPLSTPLSEHSASSRFTVETVSLLLSHRAISPNGVHPVGSGTTPLHLAASLGRVDVVNLLLEQDGVDDGLRDKDGKTCRDVTKAKDVIRAIDGNVLSSVLFRIFIVYATQIHDHS
jgi:ankyrin repeat protein